MKKKSSKQIQKNKGGRPQIALNEEQIRELARIQCTNTEIAAVMRCSQDTIERRFAGIIKEAREEGKSSLRRAQYQAAMKGNSAMLIWLGKHLLDQKDENHNKTSYEPEVRELLKKWSQTT